MNFADIINSATMGNPKRIKPLVLWTVLEYLLRGMPYGILMMVILEIFNPIQYPSIKFNLGRVCTYCLFLLINIIVLYIVNQKSYFAAYRDGYVIGAEGRLKIATHLKHLALGFYNKRDPGDIGAYIVSDYTNVETLLSHIVPQFIGAMAMPVILLISLAFFSWQLTLAAASVIPLAFPTVWISIKIINHFGNKHVKIKNETSSRLLEYIQGIKLIKSHNLSGDKFDRLEAAFRKLKTESIKLESGAGPTMILSSFILNGGFTVIILFGFNLLVNSAVSLPVYIMFLILGSRIYEPLFHALLFIGELNYSKIGVSRIENLRNTKQQYSSNKNYKIENCDIEFKNVSFSYYENQILKNISFSIKQNTFNAIVGVSGSGKTTIARLIARFWDVESGSIEIGGKDIREYSMENLLSKISVVFQDVYLFNDSIYNNILVGNPNANYDEVVAAAKKAMCHDFIMKLPEEYATIIGEGGSTLSGGEKQRISIARAILKNSDIILLDEATAALDPMNEQSIQCAIKDLVKHKTVVVIAHKLNTIAKADKIIVVDSGIVLEEGSHELLIKKEGLYKKLYEEQQKIAGWRF